MSELFSCLCPLTPPFDTPASAVYLLLCPLPLAVAITYLPSPPSPLPPCLALFVRSGGGSGAAASDSDRPPLGEAVAPSWPELAVAVAEKRRELRVERAPGADGAFEALDPALWHHGVLNRLELKIGCTCVYP